MNKHEIELSETLSATEQENYTQNSVLGRSTSLDLVEEVLVAHGGCDLWKEFSSVTAEVVSGGFLWGMKGIELDDAPRQNDIPFR